MEFIKEYLCIYTTLQIRKFQFVLILNTLLLSLILAQSCKVGETNPAESENVPTECPAEQWDDDTDGYYAYTHDCIPYKSTYFTVYSDGSSIEAKQFLAELAEGTFNELIESFLVQNIQTELQFTPGYTYYIYAEKHIPNPLAMGYRNGFYIAAIDCAVIQSPYSRPAFYNYLLKHELTHVFQFTLTGCPGNSECPDWLSVWFREGQAIFMGEHPGGIIIGSLQEYRDWIYNPEHINPIGIYRWIDFPDPDRGGQYYPMFGLAYSYLVDTTSGLGASIMDMRTMFQYMKNGESFYEAFEHALGISVEWYKDNFYTLMEEYLTTLNKNFRSIIDDHME